MSITDKNGALISEDKTEIWKLFRDTFTFDEFYINESSGPAFIILSTQFGKWDLMMYQVGLVGTYKTRAKALVRMKRLVEESANVPMKVYRLNVKNKKKVLFAENKFDRVDWSKVKPDAPVRTLEIPEWNVTVIDEQKKETEQ